MSVEQCLKFLVKLVKGDFFVKYAKIALQVSKISDRLTSNGRRFYYEEENILFVCFGYDNLYRDYVLSDCNRTFDFMFFVSDPLFVKGGIYVIELIFVH